ncbi:hypothetical protein RYX36_036125, partial [Vicia faba]
MNKVMRRYSKIHKHEDVVESFSRLDKFGVKKKIALNKLLNTLVKGQNIESSHNFVIEFKDSIPLSFTSFNILIIEWCRVRKYENMRK